MPGLHPIHLMGSVTYILCRDRYQTEIYLNKLAHAVAEAGKFKILEQASRLKLDARDDIVVSSLNSAGLTLRRGSCVAVWRISSSANHGLCS